MANEEELSLKKLKERGLSEEQIQELANLFERNISNQMFEEDHTEEHSSKKYLLKCLNNELELYIDSNSGKEEYIYKNPKILFKVVKYMYEIKPELFEEWIKSSEDGADELNDEIHKEFKIKLLQKKMDLESKQKDVNELGILAITLAQGSRDKDCNFFKTKQKIFPNELFFKIANETRNKERINEKKGEEIIRKAFSFKSK